MADERTAPGAEPGGELLRLIGARLAELEAPDEAGGDAGAPAGRRHRGTGRAQPLRQPWVANTSTALMALGVLLVLLALVRVL